MRTPYTGRAGRLLVILSVTCVPAPISLSILPAEEVAVEPFDYDPGELDGQDGGEGWGGPWLAVPDLTEIIDTTAASLRYAVPGGGAISDGGTALEVLPNHDNIVYRDLGAPEDRDEIYVSLLVQFNGTVDDNDFLGLWFDEFPGGTHTTAPNIGLKSNQGNGSGPLDLFARTGLGAEVYSEDIEPGSTYLVVGRLSKSFPGELEPYDQYELWVNPAFQDDDSPEATATGLTLGSFSIVGVRVPTLDAGDSALIGSIRLGTEWEDVVPPPAVPAGPAFRRGDADGTGSVNLTDAIFTLNHLFLAGPPPGCFDAADSDDSGSVNLTDAIFTLNHLFLAGPPPEAPGPQACGVDPTADNATCDNYPRCP